MPNIQVQPEFSKLIALAWGSQYGNIRIVKEGQPAVKSWHLELDSITVPEGAHAFWSTTGFNAPKRKHTKSDTSYVGVLWVDIDDPAQMTEIVEENGDEHEIQRIFDPQPNFIIETSPGKAHLFYVIDPVASQDLGLLESVQASLSEHLGGDKGSRDLGHISRVPGSINPKNGHVVTIEELHGQVYDLSELNPTALAPGEGRHADAVQQLASAVRNGEDPVKRLEQLEQVRYTEPFEEDEREGLLEWAETADVAALAPDPIDGLHVQRWTAEAKPRISDYSSAMVQAGLTFQPSALGGRIIMNGNYLTDGLFNELREHMFDQNFKIKEHLEVAVSATASRSEEFNPIIDWIEKNPWDGNDHIDQLADYFDDENDMFRTFIKRWLIGAIARLLETPSGTQNRMLILEGLQGIGKSYFAQWLVPLALKEFFTDSYIDPTNKDYEILSTEKWIWEVAELGGVTKRADQERLKAFLTKQKTSVRKPYAKYAGDELMRASFIGTVNELAGFLTDPTGNRRYMITNLVSINHDYAVEVALKQVWAQALHLYRHGEPWELTKEENRTAEEINMTAMEHNKIVVVLEDLLDVDPEGEDYLTLTEVMDLLGTIDGGKPPTPQEVAGGLQLLGSYKRTVRLEGKRKRVWMGITRKVGERA